MRITVDRIEGDRAVLEFASDGGAIETVAIPLAALPKGTLEGAELSFHAELTDTSEAEARLARLRKKTDQGPGTFDL